MPKNLPKGANLRILPQGILERPECAKLLGAIVAEWSLLEASLAATYSFLACGPLPNGADSTTEHLIAIGSFESVITVTQKRAMLINAAERRGFAPEIIKQFSKLIREAQDAYEERARPAHGRWLLSDDFPDSVIYVRNAGKSEDALVYDLDDLHRILDSVSQAGYNLQRFYTVELLPKLKANAK
jgi:hypothetical protein